MFSSRNSSSYMNDDRTVGSSEPEYDIASAEYALRCKEFLRLLQDLNNMGADKYFDMPRIIVIGGQSAGKGSLFEAVSGIYVPQDSGGTRAWCPMECSMSSNANFWSCQITLRYSVDADGLDLATSERASFGPTITDRGSVELWLCRAEASILSPHMNRIMCYSKTFEELQEIMRTDQNVLPFSKNVIQIEVKDPELTDSDLSFINLPGLIQNSEADVINSVRESVESHISGQNTVILVTIPMSDNIEKQQAVCLAKEADPGERTIGVLTKPDALASAAGTRKTWMDIIKGNQYSWMEIIKGRQHPLKRGYYCVRLPDENERARNISRTESSRIGDEFFNSTAPWNSVTNLKRFGVDNLVSDLSQILVNLIDKNLPNLRSTIDKQLETCHVQLGKLPAPLTTDPATEFLLRVKRFCADFHKAVLGEAHRDLLVQYSQRQYDEFKSEIYST